MKANIKALKNRNVSFNTTEIQHLYIMLSELTHILKKCFKKM